MQRNFVEYQQIPGKSQRVKIIAYETFLNEMFQPVIHSETPANAMSNMQQKGSVANMAATDPSYMMLIGT